MAFTFSDKGYPSLSSGEEVPFSLVLENYYSDYESTKVIDEAVSAFLEKYKIKGASVAVTRDEKLVYAKGFGFANVEKQEQVKPGHLFRLASVSKLITAVAVMKLKEEGLLSLDEKVFGPGGILNDSCFLNYRDPRYEDIEVKHLLNHTAGWSRRNGDPVFNSLYIARKLKVPPPASFDQVLAYALSAKLSSDPGKKYSYSNLGYVILGKIIEKKSGMPYQDYVVMHILKPVGIHDMHLGHSFYHEKYRNEVHYYNEGKTTRTYSINGSGQMVPAYYGGNNMELLGPAGGWVASAPELAKFITAVDAFNIQPDILRPEDLEIMTNPELSGKGLFGWRGSDFNGTWWRTGYLEGSAAMIVRQHDGTNWVILLNTTTTRQSHIHRYVSSMMFKAVNSVRQWPGIDLFIPEKKAGDDLSLLMSANPKVL
ncbi:MAG: serine hydrolase domain-containing protein [Bacteroidota bacterium]